MSLRDKILEADDLDHEDVEVPEWDVTVRVLSPTVRERARIVRDFMDATGKVDIERMYPALVIVTATDPETGEHLFTAADEEALSAKSGRAMERVAQAAMRVAGMSDGVVDAGKDG